MLQGLQSRCSCPFLPIRALAREDIRNSSIRGTKSNMGAAASLSEISWATCAATLSCILQRPVQRHAAPWLGVKPNAGIRGPLA